MNNNLLKKLVVDVVDQYGKVQSVEAIFDTYAQLESFKLHDDQISYLNVDNEMIKPSFDMLFFSNRTGKIFKFV